MLKWMKSLGLGVRIIVVTLVILVTVIVVNDLVFVNGYRSSAVEAMVAEAGAFTAVADEAKNHAAQINKTGAFDMKMLLDDLKATQAAGKSYRDAKIFNTIPVVVGWRSAEEAAKREKINFKVTTYDARNPVNEAKPGTFEAKLLTELTANFKHGGDETIHAVDPATNSLHYMRAVKLSADCMLCHGKPGNEWDTDKDGKDPLGFAMESWSVGDMHGAYHVIMPLDKVDAQVGSFVSNGLMWTVPLVLAGVVAFIWLPEADVRPAHRPVDRTHP